MAGIAANVAAGKHQAGQPVKLAVVNSFDIRSQEFSGPHPPSSQLYPAFSLASLEVYHRVTGWHHFQVHSEQWLPAPRSTVIVYFHPALYFAFYLTSQ